jgi:hypothetical protein
MIEIGHELLIVMFSVLRMSFGQEGLSLDNNYITSLASSATGAWDNICSLASYLLTKGKGESISLLEAQDS